MVGSTFMTWSSSAHFCNYCALAKSCYYCYLLYLANWSSYNESCLWSYLVTITVLLLSNLFIIYRVHPSVGQWSERTTSVLYMLGVTGSAPRFRKPEEHWEVKVVCLDSHPIANSHAAAQWFLRAVQNRKQSFLSQGSNRRSICELVPPSLFFIRFVPCCHCLCICSFVPCHWNEGLLRLVRIKEYGLGTQSLGLNCPLS